MHSLWRAPAGIVPLVTEAFGWQHGTFLVRPPAAKQLRPAGKLAVAARSDGDAAVLAATYGAIISRTICKDFGARPGAKLPKIYYVNWFRHR